MKPVDSTNKHKTRQEHRLYKNTPLRDPPRRIIILKFNNHERAVDIALLGIVGELDRAVEALAHAQQLGQPEFSVRDGEVDEVLWHRKGSLRVLGEILVSRVLAFTG